MMEAKKVKPDLPEGWEWTKIEAIAKLNFRDPGISSLPDNLIVTFLPMAAVDAEKGIIADPEKRQLAQVRKGFTSFSEKDVLFAKITPSMENGKAAIACDLINGRGFGSTEFHVMSPKAGILSEWLFYFIRQEEFRRNAKANFVGTAGQLRVPADFIKNYLVPLAPFPEQRRIVARIEELFSSLDAGVEALKRAKAQIRRYRQAILKAAVEGKLTEEWRMAHPEVEPAENMLERIREERIKRRKKNNSLDLDKSRLPNLPSQWTWTTIEQFADVETGATPLRSNPKYYEKGKIPWVTSGALNDYFINKATEFITELAIRETNAKVFPVHTLLVAMYGEGKTRGKVSELLIEAATNQACAALLFEGSAELIRPYIKIFFLKIYETIRRLSSGGVQPNLNLSIIKSTQVPLPPFKELKIIVKEIENCLTQANKVNIILDQDLRRSELLRQSILKRAFDGRLVYQNPSDEPASILLRKIIEEKEKRKMKTDPLKRISRRREPMPQIRSNLHEVLSEAKTQMTPRDLFYSAGFKEETIDEFYQELREEVKRSRIIEIRPNDDDVYLKVVRNEN